MTLIFLATSDVLSYYNNLSFIVIFNSSLLFYNDSDLSCISNALLKITLIILEPYLLACYAFDHPATDHALLKSFDLSSNSPVLPQ